MPAESRRYSPTNLYFRRRRRHVEFYNTRPYFDVDFSSSRYPRKPKCGRRNRVSTLNSEHSLTYKYFRFNGRHFEFPLIVLLGFSDPCRVGTNACVKMYGI